MSDSEFDEVVQYGSKRSPKPLLAIAARSRMGELFSGLLLFLELKLGTYSVISEVASKVRIESSFDTLVRINITENIARRNALGFEVQQFLIEIVEARNNVLYGITTKIVKRMETRLRRRKEELSETPFSEDNIINRQLECSVQYQRMTSCFKIFLRATGLEQSFIYKTSLPELVTLIVRLLYRNFHVLKATYSKFKYIEKMSRCNLNELFNNTVVSKNVFMESYILKLDVYDIIIFTDGNTGRLKKLRGKMTILKELDKQKVNKVQLQAEILSKMIRSLER
ncbi:LOW QUALITY PROTEIN: odorant receptor 13a-like [Vespula maculifrons]|uniref:Odorant receptor 13a-like n=1 Tax=Vespula maculifrons TaxID=7453 RepID=A0ABD2BPD4_VESMC